MSRANSILDRLNETALPRGWFTPLGSNAVILDVMGEKIPSAIENLITFMYGHATGPTHTPSTNATVRLNKSMTFNYGFDNTMLSNFFNLNGKGYSHKEFLRILKTKGVKIVGVETSDEQYAIRWGSRGIMLYNFSIRELSFYRTRNDLISEWREETRLEDDSEAIMKKLRAALRKLERT